MVKLKNELWDTLINTSPALESLNQGGDETFPLYGSC